MIDLIIPVYNNYQGLLRTLMSINLEVFEITVVDDCSNQPIETTFPINYIRLEQNSGPGWARQIGINNTHNKYIAFIDAGDIFISFDIQDEIRKTIELNPAPNIFSWSYIHETKTDEADNRLHGKVYKRSFLNKYNITFCKEGSYANEDIGFNHTCRMCTQFDGQEVYFMNIPIINWIKDENSITEKNNGEFLYKTQNRGLAINIIHTIEICKANNIGVQTEINFIAMALYYWFVRAAADRPEFMQEAWSGAKIFYDKFKDEIKPNQLIQGNAFMKKCLDLRKKINFPINVLRFIDDVQKNEIILDKYLT